MVLHTWSGSTNTLVMLISAGLGDAAGNMATTDAAGYRAYSDGKANRCQFFFNHRMEVIKLAIRSITANMSEVVLDGAALNVTLGTGSGTVVELTAATNGTTLSGVILLLRVTVVLIYLFLLLKFRVQ